MERAGKTNGRRDRTDSSAGFAPPGRTLLDVHLKTVESAIEAGIRMDDRECLAEGLVMLRNARQRLSRAMRQAEEGVLRG